uniref:Putative reverse transcriptase domain-containing protein n=1 Tax=Tanacetum cinerariifolium TaxID=118510 RepID=A0A6L2N7G1_TANCI|nr:putative reverse transcriptase domain-containing protein [Tanacetum cinerariifolium]
MSGCRDDQKVKYMVGSFVGKALTWWNSQTHTRGREADLGMSWEDFKTLTKEEFCPSNEMQKLETELWNQAMVRVGHAAYTDRFHELARLVPYLIAGTLTDEAIRNGSIKKNLKKRRNGGEPEPSVAVNGGQGLRNNGNLAHGSAFVLGVEEACQDPNIRTGMFTLNNHYATTLFDSGVYYSFVSTTFIPLQGIKPSDLGFCYEIKIASGHLLEINKVLRVLGERLEEKARHLMSAKAKEQKQEEIFVVRDFLETRLEHEVHLGLILELLNEEKLYDKFSKCEFWLREVQFLGHVINEDGIDVDRSKIEAVKNREAFRTPSEVCSFIGLAGYYRRFIKNFYKIAKSLTILTQKKVRYASRRLKIHEKNYTIHNLELGTVVFTLKIWRHYLYGTKSVIYTDHKSLQHIFSQKELNMRQHRCIELFCDYDYEVRYHPGKANVVVDAEEVSDKSTRLQKGLDKMIKCRDDGALYYMDRIWVCLKGGLRTLIIDESYKSMYSIHPGADKMNYDLRDMYWWSRMKKVIVVYVSRYLTCLKVNAKYQRLSGLLQQPEITEWKWERIAMDFITKLPRTSSRHDIIWVIMNRLTKFSHFLPMHEDYKMDRLARLYLNKISMQEAFETKLDLSTTYHPQIDGQSERTIQTLDDMLRACVLDFEGKVREGQLIGPELVQETTEKIPQIKDRLKADSPAEEVETEPNVWDDGSEDVNPFGEGKPRYCDRRYHLRRNDHAVVRDDPIRIMGLEIKIPEFIGKVHPDDFINRLSTVERVFDVRDIPDKLKVKLMAIKLRQHASLWRDHVNNRQRIEGKSKVMTWEKMTKLLKAKFLPKNHHQEAFLDYHNLSQRNMMVEEVINKFDKLCMRSLKVKKQIKAKSKGTTSRFTPPTRTAPPTTPKATTPTSLAACNTRKHVNNAPRCYKCSGLGHYARNCLNLKILAFIPDDADPIYDIDAEPKLDKPGNELVYPDRGEALVIQRVLNVDVSKFVDDSLWLRNNIFRTKCTSKGKICDMIIDGGSCENVVSTYMVEKLGMKIEDYPKSYQLTWFKKWNTVKVSKRCLVQFSIGKNYKDELWCEVIPLDVAHIQLGHPWQFYRKTKHKGF